MPKADKKKSKVLSKDDVAKAKRMARFSELTDKALDYLAACQDAMLPCTYCQATKEGTVYAAKYDAEGKCIKCHGTGLVPDREVRKWATDEITARGNPKPKAIEMEVDDKRDVDEFSEALSNKTDEEIADLAKALNLNIDSNGD